MECGGWPAGLAQLESYAIHVMAAKSAGRFQLGNFPISLSLDRDRALLRLAGHVPILHLPADRPGTTEHRRACGRSLRRSGPKANERSDRDRGCDSGIVARRLFSRGARPGRGRTRSAQRSNASSGTGVAHEGSQNPVSEGAATRMLRRAAAPSAGQEASAVRCHPSASGGDFAAQGQRFFCAASSTIRRIASVRVGMSGCLRRHSSTVVRNPLETRI
jgi:hypothetical protein